MAENAASIRSTFVRSQAALLRDELVARRGHRCEACGWGFVGVDAALLQVHHVVPVARGGGNDDLNLSVLCPNDHAVAHALAREGEVATDKSELLRLIRTSRHRQSTRHLQRETEKPENGRAQERQPTRYLTRNELCRRWGISRSTSYRYEREGYLPKPARLGPGAARWPLNDIKLLEQRAADDRSGAEVRRG